MQNCLRKAIKMHKEMYKAARYALYMYNYVQSA